MVLWTGARCTVAPASLATRYLRRWRRLPNHHPARRAGCLILQHHYRISKSSSPRNKEEFRFISTQCARCHLQQNAKSYGAIPGVGASSCGPSQGGHQPAGLPISLAFILHCVPGPSRNECETQLSVFLSDKGLRISNYFVRRQWSGKRLRGWILIVCIHGTARHRVRPYLVVAVGDSLLQMPMDHGRYLGQLANMYS